MRTGALRSTNPWPRLRQREPAARPRTSRVGRFAQVFSGPACRRRARPGFIAAIVAVFLIGFFSYRSTLQRAEAARQVAHTIDVTDHLDALLSTFQDAETGQRGYLLTGDERYLEPYHAATAALQAEFHGCACWSATARTSWNGWTCSSAWRATRTRSCGRPSICGARAAIEQALEMVRTDRGKQAMDEIRKTIPGCEPTSASCWTYAAGSWQRRPRRSSRPSSGAARRCLLFLIGGGGEHVVARLHGPAHAGLDPHGRERAGGPDAGDGTDRGAGPADRHVPGRVPAGRRRRRLLRGVRAARCGGWAATRCRTTAATRRWAASPGRLSSTIARSRRSELPADFFPVSSGAGRAPARHAIVLPTTADRKAERRAGAGLSDPRPAARPRAAGAHRGADRPRAALDQGPRRPARRAGGDAAPVRGAADPARRAARAERGARAAEPRASGLAGSPREPAGRAGADQRQPGRADARAGTAARAPDPRPVRAAAREHVQIRVPGQHVARAADAAEQHADPGQAAGRQPRRQPERRADQVRGDHLLCRATTC